MSKARSYLSSGAVGARATLRAGVARRLVDLHAYTCAERERERERKGGREGERERENEEESM